MTTQRTRTPRKAAPSSPEDFVAEAERMTNERDVQGVRGVYAPDATWISTVDGLVMRADGIEEIVARWGLMCRFMQARRMYVHKQLVASDDRTIVNEWTGSLGDRTAARGIEVWRFDDHGRVEDQHLYGFLNTGSDTDALPSLRMLAAYPLTALTFGRLRLTSGRAS
jgi:nuclear transport factor 2 (NTF2) superfamily protein